jgi:hypothetical protein
VFFVCIFSLFNIINIVSYIEIISVFNNFSNYSQYAPTKHNGNLHKTDWKHPLLNHFEFWTLDAIQRRIIFCFQTCLNKRVADEHFCRQNVGQAQLSDLWSIYYYQIDVLFRANICICCYPVTWWMLVKFVHHLPLHIMSSVKVPGINSVCLTHVLSVCGRRCEEWTSMRDWTSIWVYQIYFK